MGQFSEKVEKSLTAAIGLNEKEIWEASLLHLNKLGWQLSWRNLDNEWHLYSNNHIIYICQKWFEIQSFIYGIVLSSMNISHRLKSRSRKLKKENSINDLIELKEWSVTKIFDELTSISEHILHYEKVFATPGRATLIYRDFQKRKYSLEKDSAKAIEKFAQYYERKQHLEKSLLILSTGWIDVLKSRARQLKHLNSMESDILPFAIAFFFEYLKHTNSSWYNHRDSWLYYEGDQLIFSSENREDFVGFVSGMAYTYAQLSDEVLKSKVMGSK